MPFGLFSTESTTGQRSIKSRRKLFWQFPTGAFPFLGFLSMLPQEATDKAEFGWWERRFPVLRTNTAASGTSPFANEDGSAFADGGTLTENVEYRLNVVSTAQFKPTHVIMIRDVLMSGTTTNDVKGTVTEISSSTVLKFRPYATWTTVQNATNENNGLSVAIIGTANPEGGRSTTGTVGTQINPTNYTQIFRTAFNITRTALKGGLEYDRSGPYKILCKDNGMRHMIEMEKAFLFGTKHTVLVTDPDTGESTPETKTGGVIWFLEQWEAANSIYRGGTGVAAVTANTDDNKRIIDAGGSLSKVDYNTYISRLFKYTNNKAYEKIGMCGGKFLETVNSLFERDVTRNVVLKEKERNVEFMVHSHTTLRGTVHYKVHPLFDEDPDLADCCLFLDIADMMYRPLSDSDTVFLKGRQENDRDGRKDEWITEAGLELKFPEQNMFIKNATNPA